MLMMTMMMLIADADDGGDDACSFILDLESLKRRQRKRSAFGVNPPYCCFYD